MRHLPSLDEFRRLAEGHSLVPVYRQLIGDTLTPVSAFCKIQEGDWAFLFESVVGGERLGRYSFVGSGPFLCFQAFDRRVVIRETRKGETRPTVVELDHPDPLPRGSARPRKRREVAVTSGAGSYFFHPIRARFSR